MITLAYILELPTTESNLFKVRVPIFEQPGELNEGQIMYANLAYNPGNLNSYRIGDCVVVGFLDNKIFEPIIIGKLLTNASENKATNFSFANALYVESNAKLPAETVIGDISYSDIAELKRKVDNLWVNSGLSNDSN